MNYLKKGIIKCLKPRNGRGEEEDSKITFSTNWCSKVSSTFNLKTRTGTFLVDSLKRLFFLILDLQQEKRKEKDCPQTPNESLN